MAKAEGRVLDAEIAIYFCKSPQGGLKMALGPSTLMEKRPERPVFPPDGKAS